MRTVKLDVTNWRTIKDFYDALFAAIGAPAWHGVSPDALVDSMIWGGINTLEPPYTIRISEAAATPKNVCNEIAIVKWALGEGRKDYQERRDGDVEVSIEIAS